MEQIGNITLQLGDCMDILPSLPDKSFDLAIVDPPYFSGPERRQFYGSRISATKVERKEYPVSDNWQVPDASYFRELERVSKSYIVWGCNYYDYRFNPGRIVWDKCNGKSSFSDCEIAATNLFDSVRLFPFMWNGMLQGKNMNEGRVMQGNKILNEKRIHPTQKPVALYEWLLSKWAQPDWKILDTHLGSGSIAIACWNYGCSLFGIEIDKFYFEAARQRIINHVSNLRLALY
ncbi:MAG: site-specific DNA-methyltransferase [Bacteroides sp.]|nr:site-specific DNA-methyltransferase [Bacteroides sp.]